MIVLGALFFINKSGVDFEDPTTINLLRISFCVVTTVDILLQFYISTVLERKKQTDDDYAKKKLYFPKPPNPFSPTVEYEPVPCTTAKYEQQQQAQVHNYCRHVHVC